QRGPGRVRPSPEGLRRRPGDVPADRAQGREHPELEAFTGQAPAGLEDDTEPAVVEAPGGRLVATAPGGPQARDPQPPRGGAILRGQLRPEGEPSLQIGRASCRERVCSRAYAQLLTREW